MLFTFECDSQRLPISFFVQLLEVFNFILLGVVGAVLGTACTWLNVRVSRWRHRHLRTHRWRKVAEAVFWAFVTATVMFVLPYIFGCRAKHDQCDRIDTGTGIQTRCAQFFCPNGYYSEIGSLFFTSIEQTTRILFDRSLRLENHISLNVFLVFSVVYTLLTAVVYGLYVPGGLFVPSILIGACYGRFLGVVCGLIFPHAVINPGVYAMIGAGSMMGGFTRLALPAVIMLIEMTGDATYLLPITISTLVAKLLGDRLSLDFYTQQRDIDDIPQLAEDLPPGMSTLTVRDILIYDSTALKVVDTIENCISLLYRYNHIMIPVVNLDGTYAGMISRRAVIYTMKFTPLYESLDEALGDQENVQKNQCIYDAEEQMSAWEDFTDYATTLSKSAYVK